MMLNLDPQAMRTTVLSEVPYTCAFFGEKRLTKSIASYRVESFSVFIRPLLFVRPAPLARTPIITPLSLIFETSARVSMSLIPGMPSLVIHSEMFWTEAQWLGLSHHS